MKLLDLTFSSPEENLACDEVLLDRCEEGAGEETLRFWEPGQLFVVLGYFNRANEEVDLEACHQAEVKVLRRPSGGGAVLQGPGCLNFSLVLKAEGNEALSNITRTNAFVLERHCRALAQAAGSPAALPPDESVRKGKTFSADGPLSVEGTSDLAWNGKKISGNAQRRKRRFVLFHGTFLLGLDLKLVGRFLKMPSRRPEWRQDRAHEDFLVHLPLSRDLLKQALCQAWEARHNLTDVPLETIRRLVRERYARDEWNFKF